jgi:hypothetical protein
MSQPPAPVATPFAPPPPRPPAARPRAILVHLGWEAILLVLVLFTAAVVALDGTLFRGATPWYNLAAAGLLASAFALSLRTATPNLAVGAIAVLAGATYAKLVQNDVPGLLAGVAAVLAALLVFANHGLIQADAPRWVTFYVPAALAILLGVVVSRLTEALAGPYTAVAPAQRP